MSIKKYKVKPVNDIFTVWKIPFADIESAGLSLKDKNDTYSVERHSKEKDWDIGLNAGMFSNGPKGKDPFYYWNISDLIVDGKVNNQGNYSSTGIAFGDPWEGISAYQSTTKNSTGNKVDFLGGSPTLIENSIPVMDLTGLSKSFVSLKTQRTAVGANSKHLIFLSSKSKAANLYQVQDEMLQQGCTIAINVDGGGSTAVWTKDGSDSYTQGRNVTSAMGLKLKKKTTPPPVTKNRWIMDAGHGGTDPGAVANGIVEKIWTLEAAKYVQERLIQFGIPCDITRTNDISLSVGNRVDIVSQYTHCISHHFNSSATPGATGLEMIRSIYADGRVPELIKEAVLEAGYLLRGNYSYTRTLTNGKDYYYMHRDTGNCQVTIVEYDFINGLNAEKLKSYDHRVGLYEAVVKAICKFEGVLYLPPKKETPVLHKVQVGAFESRERAEALEKRLRSDGYLDTMIVEVMR